MEVAPSATGMSSGSVLAEKVSEDPFVERCVEGSALLHAHAERYSQGVQTLVAELEAINQVVVNALDGFSGASLASQLMAAEDAAATGGQTTPVSESRRGLRGQRKPGAQLLWGGGAGTSPAPESQAASSCQVAVDVENGPPDAGDGESLQDALVRAGGEVPSGDGELPAEELAGSSILVLLQDQPPPVDDQCAPLNARTAAESSREGGDGKIDGESKDNSRNASRASTRPHTTAEHSEAGVREEGSKVATRPQTRADSVLEEGGEEEQDLVSGQEGGELGRQVTGTKDSCEPASVHENECATSLVKGQPEGLCDESLREYEEGREELIGYLRENTADCLSERRQGIPCGLRNQGSTCYLNSLLQTLYHVPEFRSFALSWHSEQSEGDADGTPESACIPSQLRMLFAAMHSSHHLAVSTEGLTRSFGWGSAAAFQQHDCSELLHILFEALRKASKDKFGAVQSLFQGASVSYIGSEERGVWRGREETFLGLQLQVEGMHSVEEAVKAYIEPEVLEGDNMWRLDDGSMVTAVKGLFPKALPPILVLDLKRFKYGMSGREKVETPQSIALELNVGDILQQCRPAHVGNVLGDEDVQSCQDKGLYDIQAVLLHRGTAMGGHYSCVLREWDVAGGGLGRWLHCNDSAVTEVGEDKVQALLKRGCVGIELRAEQKHAKESTAYMLVYRRRGMPAPMCGSVAPQGEVLSRVEKENANLVRLQRLFKVHESLCEIKVFLPDEHQVAITLRLPKSLSLADATEEVRGRLLLGIDSEGLRKKLEHKDCEYRLRRYEFFSGSLGETFGGKESQTLEVLGLMPTCQIVFEARGQGEEEFAEHDDWTFRVGRWEGIANEQDPTPLRWERVTIRRGTGATVGALRHKALAVLGMPQESSVALVICGERGQGCKTLGGDNVLLEASGATRGAEIVVDDSDGTCQALEFFQSLQSKADVSFNHPARPDSSPFSLHADVRWTLNFAKCQMAEMLGVDAENIHLRRSARTPQLKDESATLASVGVSHGSTLFVGQGAPRGEGQVLLKVFLGTEGAGVKSLVQLTVDEKDTVAELKQLLSVRLSKLKESPHGWTGDASLIRVRDKKGKEIGKALCDDSALKKALPRLTDGKEIVVQMLSAPETVSESSIIIQVRHWDFEENHVHAAREMVISKKASCDELRHQILSVMPEVNSVASDASGDVGHASEGDSPSSEAASVRVGLAKASAFGPPLDSAGAARLKWNDGNAETRAVCEAPWSLRDGSILVVRDERKFALRPPPSQQPAKGAKGAVNKARRSGAGHVREGGLRERGITIAVWGENRGDATEENSEAGERVPGVGGEGCRDAVRKGVAFDVVV
mmetsp:Transcript_7686/g.18713  ORF Transcript_7686/g.18713 Transcript_7686/m.18713 type:complete len:1339 (-) Transcript_7686:66-4082(-)